MSDPWIVHPQLDLIVKAGVLGDEARVVDLPSHERAVVWIDGRLRAVLGPGVYALWTVLHDVRVEVFDAREGAFEHPDLQVILAAPGASEHLQTATVAAGWTGMLYRDGRLAGQLAPGVHAFWKGEEKTEVFQLDLRERALDVSGQEIMTADRVTLRLNALAVYRVADPEKAVTEVDDHVQALYRQAQLALRAIVGTRELDALRRTRRGSSRRTPRS